MTESEKPQAPEHLMQNEDDNDTEGHRVAFQGDEQEDNDTEGHRVTFQGDEQDGAPGMRY